jgi:hypothetical protein
MPEAKCHTCHTNARHSTPEGKEAFLPAGWVAECRRCAENSGRAKRSIRHCANCQTPIVVMSVPSAVRLICRDCAEKDVVLLDAERLSQEARKNYERMVQVSRQLEDVERDKEKLERRQQSAINRAVTEVKATLEEKEKEIRELQAKLDTSAEDRLAARIKAKMVAQYGIEEREAFEALLMWAVRTNRLPTIQDPGSYVTNLLDEYMADLDG